LLLNRRSSASISKKYFKKLFFRLIFRA